MKSKISMIGKSVLGIFFVAVTVLMFVVSSNCYFVSLVPHKKNTENLDLSGQYLFSLDEVYQFKNLKSIDLRGKAVEYSEIERLLAAYPGLSVRWDIKIGDVYCDSASTDISVKNITPEDFEKLALFPNLKSVSITDTPYSQELENAITNVRDIEIIWSFAICSKRAMSNSAIIDLSGTDVDAQTLANDLGQFKNVRQVNVRNTGLTAEEIRSLSEKFKSVHFIANVEYNGMSIDTASTEIPSENLDYDTLDYILTVSKGITRVNMESSSLGESKIKKLADKFTDVLFIFNTTLAGKEFSTAVEEIDLNKAKIDDFDSFKKELSYFRNLKKAELCMSNLKNSEMEMLCNTYPETKFVWVVKMSYWDIRTDATAFSCAYIKARTTSKTIEEMVIPKDQLEVLKYCTDLEALDLGHMGITDISVISNLKKLKILILADNRISDISPLSELENLVYAELFVNRISDISPLLSSKNTLLDLNICRNPIEDTSAICKLSKLERLWMCMTDIAKDENNVEKIRQALPGCEVNTTADDSVGKGWRKHPRYYWMRDCFGLFYLD